MTQDTAAPLEAPRPMTALAAGASALWLYRAHRLLQRLSGNRASLNVYLFCAQPVGSAALKRVRDDASTRVVSVGPGDPLLSVFPRPQTVLAQRFATGASCHAVIVKEQFAGHIWLASDRYDEDEVRCRYVLPDATTVWDFDVYVSPPFRATRAMARLWKGVDAVLQSRGVAWSCSRISLYNAASIQTHERLGARHLCTGAFLTMGALQAALFTRPMRVHLTMSASQVPMLAIPRLKSTVV